MTPRGRDIPTPLTAVRPQRDGGLTTTEAAVLALLGLEGERSGYDLLKQAGRAIGYIWAPAKTQLYATLARLAKRGLARRRSVAQADRPDKQLYSITPTGSAALTTWLELPQPGLDRDFGLRLFVGGLMSPEALIGHVERYRAHTVERLEEYRRIEPTNSRRGADFYHYFLLRHGIETAEHDLRWADWVLDELRAAAP